MKFSTGINGFSERIRSLKQLPAPMLCLAYDTIYAYAFLVWEVFYKLVLAYFISDSPYAPLTAVLVVLTTPPLLALVGIRFRIVILKHLYIVYSNMVGTLFLLGTAFFLVGMCTGPAELINSMVDLPFKIARCGNPSAHYVPTSNDEISLKLNLLFALCLAAFLIISVAIHNQSQAISHLIVHHTVEKMEEQRRMCSGILIRNNKGPIGGGGGGGGGGGRGSGSGIDMYPVLNASDL